ncbi:MAG: L,D-transpeptidase family protein [Anaerolineae bacterium]
MQHKSVPQHPAQPMQRVYNPHPAQRLPARRKSLFSKHVLLIGLAVSALLMIAMCGAVVLGVTMVYAQGILPGVEALGVDLGGMPPSEASARLAAQWTTVTLSDGQRTWAISPASLGLSLDTEATVRAAYLQGRGQGNMFSALFGRIVVQPIITVDLQIAQQGLASLAPTVEIAPVNAGVHVVNGQVETTPPQDGRALDISGTLARLQTQQPFATNGAFELAMVNVQPTITDASPMLAEAQRLLSNPYIFNVFDPVTGDVVQWSLMPENWATWLTAVPDSSRPTGLAFMIDTGQAADYLQAQASAVLDASRYLNIDEAAAEAQAAVASGVTQSYVRVYHHDTQYVVQPGETIVSIAWDVGVPYLYIQAANGGMESVSAGQSITIPSADNFFDYPPIPNKRIVVSISQQHMWVYENGGVIWDAVISTGIASSPTWPGIYQVISHEPNAYAGNWDLYMPNFMGIYRPIPGADFTNGFHGFPTRGGSQLLWTNNLGTRVTYGCVLVGDSNIQTLYNWAENGVVVEIQP